MKTKFLYLCTLIAGIALYACNEAGEGSEAPVDTVNTSADSMTRNNTYQSTPADTTADTLRNR